MSVFHYKGYIGSIEADPKNKVLYGRLLHINDLVTYEAANIVDLEKEFKNSVKDYLATCKKLKREPFKPFKGSLNVRIGADLHKKVALRAAMLGVTINDFIKSAVQHEIKDQAVSS